MATAFDADSISRLKACSWTSIAAVAAAWISSSDSFSSCATVSGVRARVVTVEGEAASRRIAGVTESMSEGAGDAEEVTILNEEK